MALLDALHHVAIIASDYDRSRRFYVEVLGLTVVAETYREARQSWKCDLRVGDAQIELFYFPSPPPRPSTPEAAGLRHLAFSVGDLDAVVGRLEALGIAVEPVRIDDLTSKRFTFSKTRTGFPSNFTKRDVLTSVSKGRDTATASLRLFRRSAARSPASHAPGPEILEQRRCGFHAW